MTDNKMYFVVTIKSVAPWFTSISKSVMMCHINTGEAVVTSK